MELEPGVVLRDRYRIEGVLGRGAHGTMYEAVDVHEDRFATASAALAALQEPALVTAAAVPTPRDAPPPPALPAQSAIKVDARPDQLTIEVPPLGLKRVGPVAIFSIIWLGFVAFWTFTTIAIGAPIFFPLFSIPFWVVGIGMVRKNVIAALARTELALGPERYQLGHRLSSGVLKPRSGPLADLDLARLDVTARLNNQPTYRVVLETTAHGALRIDAPLSRGERQWLVGAVNAFLAARRGV